MTAESQPLPTPKAPRRWFKPGWVFDLLLVYVLLAGAFFRAVGLYWGENQYLHPDERFLVWVGSDISPVKCAVPDMPAAGCPDDQKVWLSFSDYFDTVNSSLNPHNRGHGFYVYGTLPMFLTRYIVEWVYGHSGFEEMTVVGRTLSAVADLVAVLLVYLVAAKVYDKRVGLLAAAFSAAVVLQIQQSHFFTMDTFINMFSFLAFYIAVLVMVDERPFIEPQDGSQPPEGSQGLAAALRSYLLNPLLLPCIAFGIALGMAVSSKLNAAPMAVALPAALGIRILQMKAEDRQRAVARAFGYLVVAALVSLVVFRLLQPYAFSGPGFFGLKFNSQWLANIRELRAQSSGDVDFPPAMQWARRPIWFSGQNLVLWGLGLPLGLLAWAGFVWAGWRMLKGEWARHALLWGWTALYFTWQSLALNPTMRYQLPIYPTLAIFAGWAVVQLWDSARPRPAAVEEKPRLWLQALAVLTGTAVLVSTYAWAFAFTRVYANPVTRIAATRWIYQNIPGPINLHIQSGDQVTNQILPFPYGYIIAPSVPYQAQFKPNVAGTLAEVYLPHIIDQQGSHTPRSLSLAITDEPGDMIPLASATVTADFTPGSDPRGGAQTFTLDQPVELDKDKTYFLNLSLAGPKVSAALGSDIGLQIQGQDTGLAEQVLPATGATLKPGLPFVAPFTPQQPGLFTGLHLANVIPVEGTLNPNQFTAWVELPGAPADSGSMAAGVTVLTDTQGTGYQVYLNQPIPVTQGETYNLTVALEPRDGALTLSADGIANEGDWDDGLPLRMDGYDGFGAIYPLDLNFNMYWDDNPEKLARFTRILDQADYIVISSNRQWGSLPRIPERFPMTTVYYRNLLGCPPEKDILWCYSVASPGMFKGSLGYDLIQTFQSDPTVGPLRINDQFAEEAFTVYDHPKVLIFKKSADYNPQKAQEILGVVDFSQVIRVPPMRVGTQPANLMLPSDRLAEQQQGGTWAELFNSQAWQNRSQVLGVILWYLSLFLLGLVAYPLVRAAWPGLPDRGYPLARTAGLLLLSYLSWLAGSVRIPFTRPTIALLLGLLVAAAAVLAYRQRDSLRAELRSRGKYFLVVEGLFLAFFLFDLFIRLGNPDLWHPYKGGEKPMDFAYFNAVLKSTSFPPYDPWFAGGYLNYYYYGFVFIGVLVKLLGIVPAVAYNLAIPTLFAMIAMGAFSVAWNLVSVRPRLSNTFNYWAGLAGALGMAVLGNLGTVRMIFQGYVRLGAPPELLDSASLLMRWVYALKGMAQVLSGAQLPYGLGDWYWIPSRAIPPQGDVEPITEFPFFTALYADLHAHLFALPIALLALSFALAVVLRGGRWKGWLSGVAGMLLGALAIGALRPTNTWDFYTYLALGVVALAYTLWFNPVDESWAQLQEGRAAALFASLPEASFRLLAAVGSVALLIGLSFVLYQPFAQWYGLGYSSVEMWKGSHTPIDAYLTHWGLFLFVIVSWLVWETIDWMDKTPVSALNKLKRNLSWIVSGGILAVALLVVLVTLKASIAWVAIPLAAWAGVLILRPDQSDARRFVLFLVGTGLVLTIMVEVIVLKGDIGRMNTVFKFYLQVWTLFSVSAGAALGWLLQAMPRWQPSTRSAWRFAFGALVLAAAMYPLMAGTAKIKDRMAENAPHTLDGMAYMPYATYTDEWGAMDLGQDYDAIRWMQENVKGSPVIVEANLRNLYRWGSRYSIYTGLPGVVGWEWHQQQQRALTPSSWVSSRIAEIDNFYTTPNVEDALAFLRKYNVRYIILGQQERGHYPGIGLDKFTAANGKYWNEVYRNQDTVIYEVTPQ